MRGKEADRRATNHALEQALVYLESGHPELLPQGLVPRLEHFLSTTRAVGRDDVQAIALLRRNPGLIRLH